MGRTLRILEPCSQRWEAMRGDGSRRFCDDCRKEVHDFSSLTASEAERLLASAPAKGICAVIHHDGDGAIRWKPGGASVGAALTFVASAALVAVGCNPTDGPSQAHAERDRPAAAQVHASPTSCPPPASAAPTGASTGAPGAAAPAPSTTSAGGKTIGCVCLHDDPNCSCL